ncbi:MAG: hypothetical protein Q8N56_04635 [bacterium]|nr:hypothetical protein [bacterium]
MKITHKELCNFYQSHIMEKRFLSTDKCPSPALLNKCFSSYEKNNANTNIIDHITECASCFQVFAFLLELQRGTASIYEELKIWMDTNSPNQLIKKDSLGLSFLPKLFRSYMVLFIGIILFSTSLFLLLDKYPQASLNKNPVRENNRLIIKIIEPINSHIKKTNLRFKWNPNQQIEYYILEIFDGSLALIWESPRLIESHISISPRLIDNWQSNKTYLWIVTGYTKTGYVIESPLCEFFLID